MLKIIRLCVWVSLVFCTINSFSQEQMITQLDQLKKQNDLEKWLYVRLDKTYADPQQQLSFLMTTQKEAWRQPANLPERAAWLVLLSNQGYYQLQAGNILSSINCYEDAYSWFYKYKLQKAYDIVEYVLKPLSNNYTRLGDYERAIFIQQKAINSLSRDSVDNIASLYSNMAIAYYNMGNYPEAENSVSKGKAIVKDVQVRLQLNNTLADILYEKGDLAQASAIIKQNLAIQNKPDRNNAYWLMGEYTTLGNIQVKKNDLQSAGQNFAKALNLINTWYPGDRLREKANITAQLGKIERLKQQPQKALALLDKALQILRINTPDNKTLSQNIYGENKLVEIFHEKALTYVALDRSEPALENMRYALLATDKMRNEFADDKTRERLQRESRDMDEMAMSLAFDIANARFYDKKLLIPLLEICEQSRARTLADQITKNNRRFNANNKDTLNNKRSAIERAIVYEQKLLMTERDTTFYQKKIAALKFDLALLNKQQRKEDAGQVLPAAELLKGLPDSLHVFEYFLGSKDLYIVHIFHRKVEQVTKIGLAASIKDKVNKLVNTYYQNGPAAMLNSPREFYLLSNDIYWTLISTTNVSLKQNERICIIPDDVLGYLSFDGLITDRNYDPAISGWPFLIKKATINYAFSLNTLMKSKQNTHAGTGFGGLFITHQNSDSSKPIVAVEKEAAAIKKQIGGRYLYNDEVNTASFFDLFERSKVLHISTHAYLSGSNKEPTLDLGKEKLFLFELLAKKQQPDLIVLSACGTGDGLLAQGEGIISLSRGFSAIGTPATIASLWNVNDDAVSGITASLYQFLARGQSSGTALHNAKLAWLNSPQTSDAMYLPYYWDSLILMGTDKQEYLKPPFNWWWVYGGVGMLVVCAGVFAWMRKKKN